MVVTIPAASGGGGSVRYIAIQITAAIQSGYYESAVISVAGGTQIGSTATTAVEVHLINGQPADTVTVFHSLWQVPGNTTVDTITITGASTGGNDSIVGGIVVDTRLMNVLSPACTPTVGTESAAAGFTFVPGGSYVWDIANATTGEGIGWDMFNVTGILNITATNKHDGGVLSDVNKFTIKLVSPSGGTANFVDASSYSWVIARASGSVNQFIASKFLLDTSAFQNSGSPTVPTGSFGLVLDGKELKLVYAPQSCTARTEASFYIEPGVNGNQAVMTFQNASGLASVQALVAVNSTIHGRTWPGINDSTNSGGTDIGTVGLNAKTVLSGSPQKVVLWSTKSVAAPATVNVIAIDLCGLGKSFDPVMTDLVVGAGGAVRQHFKGLLAAERYLQVFNGTPGLRRLEINLNGHLFVLDPLADGAQVAGDLAAGMVEGDQNEVTLTGYGVAGARATVLITDMPGANSVSLAERAELALAQAAGQVVLSWPEHMTGWQLQTAETPAATVWDGVPQAPAVEAGRWTVALPTSSTARFFRLVEAAGGATASSGAAATGASLLNKVDTNSSKLIRRTYEGINW